MSNPAVMDHANLTGANLSRAILAGGQPDRRDIDGRYLGRRDLPGRHGCQLPQQHLYRASQPVIGLVAPAGSEGHAFGT